MTDPNVCVESDVIRMSVLAEVAAEMLGITIVEAEAEIRRACAELGYPIEEVGHA